MVRQTPEQQRLCRRERLRKNDMDLKFWVNSDDFNALVARAAQAGVSRAVYLRLILKRHLKEEAPIV